MKKTGKTLSERGKMLRQFGRYQGDIQNFELWDPKRTNRLAGFYFTAVAEWLPDEGGWLSVCEVCHNFRCLKIDIQKQTWECTRCTRKGSFKKPEKKKKGNPKTDKPAEREEEGMNKEKKPVIDKKRMIKLAGLYHETLEQGIRIILREERGLPDKVINKYQIGYTLRHWNTKDLPYRKHKDCITIPVYKGKELVNVRYHSRKKKADPKDLPYQTGLEFATWLYPEDMLDNDTLIFAEGELDALCAISRGLPAFTVTCGAGTWKEEFNKYFKHKVVYVIFDCDIAGREGARSVTQQIYQVAREVRIIDLDPQKKDGYDLTNWFVTDGKSKEELLKLINKSPAYVRQTLPVVEESKEKKERIKEAVDRFLEEEALDDYDLYRKEFEQEQFWVSNGLIPKRGFVLLAGHKGRGKSTLAIQLCLKLMIGNCTFLKDFKIKESPKKIVYWYAENIDAEIKKIRRAQQESLGIKLTKEQHNKLIWLKRKRLDLKNRDSLTLIKGIVEKINPDIIILDTLHRFMVGLDQDKIQTADKLFDTLEDIKPDCLWLLISHLRKPSKQDTGDTIYNVIGSSSLVNNSDVVMIMSRGHKRRAETREDRLSSKIEFTLKRARILDPIFVKLNEETRSLEVTTAGEIASQKAVTEKELCKFIKKQYEGAEATGGQIEKDAKKKFGISRSRVQQLLKEAQDMGLMTYTKPKGKKKGGMYHALYW